MAEPRPDPLADLFTLFATPLSGTVRSIEQFRKGVDEFLKGVENFNRTMENLNDTSERINSLLAEVEPPLRAAIPQVTRTVKAADEMMQVVSGPAIAVAPGLTRLAETLSTPAFAQLPAQINLFSDVLSEVTKRLGPLNQLAESAGGLFGGFRLPGARPTTPPTAAAATRPAPTAPTESARAGGAEPSQPSGQTTEVEHASPSQVPAKKTAPARKKSAAKKATAPKKSAAKKAPARKKSAAKKAPARKKSAAKKPTS